MYRKQRPKHPLSVRGMCSAPQHWPLPSMVLIIHCCPGSLPRQAAARRHPAPLHRRSAAVSHRRRQVLPHHCSTAASHRLRPVQSHCSAAAPPLHVPDSGRSRPAPRASPAAPTSPGGAPAASATQHWDSNCTKSRPQLSSGDIYGIDQAGTSCPIRQTSGDFKRKQDLPEPAASCEGKTQSKAQSGEKAQIPIYPHQVDQLDGLQVKGVLLVCCFLLLSISTSNSSTWEVFSPG